MNANMFCVSTVIRAKYNVLWRTHAQKAVQQTPGRRARRGLTRGGAKRLLSTRHRFLLYFPLRENWKRRFCTRRASGEYGNGQWSGALSHVLDRPVGVARSACRRTHREESHYGGLCA
ncbi:hypothetical protein EVAR_59553_1 [Eumeta japonica]|uniref:Uncharacterized protein n=1 Tax=Eumeta variegata TaxID=151549 RepID=A0A4C1ZV67_EUMVA|nr:hypothetical protein EVAR_59553_1 [Eumeta japonica]